MNTIREPQVAGMFYPSNPNELSELINGFLDEAKLDKVYKHVAGIISPHAGYVYSGQTAAYAYKTIENKEYSSVIVISPSHREYFPGVSIYPGDGYKTPLGKIRVSNKLREKMVGQSKIIFEGNEGHRAEHALEVQLPFLQIVLGKFELLPIVIGDQRKEFIFELADILANTIDDDTLLIASSDLSHFYPKSHAKLLDSRVAKHIDSFRFEDLQNDLEDKRCEACGGGGIVALLKALSKRNVNHTHVVAQSDSGDITGDETEVVGYLSAVVYN